MGRHKTIVLVGWGVFAAPLAEALSRLSEMQGRQGIRNSFGMTSEVLLRDIGLTPDDLAEALANPLTEQASDSLARAAAARAGNW